MKFVHVNDIRLGSSAEAGTRWDAERKEEFYAALKRVLDWARAAGADLILISGGLFAHQPVTAELEESDRLFRQYKDLEIVVIAGETDRVKKFSPIRSFLWAEHVHYILDSGVQRVDLPRLKAAVYAASRTDEPATAPAAFLLAELKGLVDLTGMKSQAEGLRRLAEQAAPIRIAMLRNEDDDAVRSGFADSGFAYVAVGQSGSRKCLIENKAYCPGVLEPEQMQESGTHGIYAGEISEDGRLQQIEFVPLSEVSYIPLKIEVQQDTSQEALEKSLEEEIQRRGEKNIYRLKLSGSRSPGESFDLERLCRRYRIAEVIDATEPVYDFAALFEEHPQDMIGFYISSIARGRQDMSPLEKKAMFYGIDALLQTAEGEKT